MMSAMRRIDGVTRVSLESSEKSDEGGGDSGSAGGEGGGNSTDCRNGSDRFPQFKMTVFFTAPVAATPAAPAGTGTTTQGAPSAATQAGNAASSSTAPAANGGAQ